MTLHIRAPRVVTDEMVEEFRSATPRPSFDEAHEALMHVFETAGDQASHFMMQQGETSGGDIVENVQFGITGRYVHNDVKYLIGNGIVLNLTSVIDFIHEVIERA